MSARCRKPVLHPSLAFMRCRAINRPRGHHRRRHHPSILVGRPFPVTYQIPQAALVPAQGSMPPLAASVPGPPRRARPRLRRLAFLRRWVAAATAAAVTAAAVWVTVAPHCASGWCPPPCAVFAGQVLGGNGPVGLQRAPHPRALTCRGSGPSLDCCACVVPAVPRTLWQPSRCPCRQHSGTSPCRTSSKSRGRLWPGM